MPRWPIEKDRIPMKLITVNCSQHYVSMIDFFVKKGVIPSRSAGVRLALSYGLPYIERMLLRQEILIDPHKASRNGQLTPNDIIYFEINPGKFEKFKAVSKV